MLVVPWAGGHELTVCGLRDLIRRICTGDQNAMAELMERYRGQLLAKASRKISDLLKRSAESDDVVQDAMTYCLIWGESAVQRNRRQARHIR
jgi:hypothetical protein